MLWTFLQIAERLRRDGSSACDGDECDGDDDGDSGDCEEDCDEEDDDGSDGDGEDDDDDDDDCDSCGKYIYFFKLFIMNIDDAAIRLNGDYDI